MQYVSCWPRIMVSMVKFDHEIDTIVIKLVYYRFCCVRDTENTEIQKPLQIFLLGEIFTASQIFGPRNNNPLYGIRRQSYHVYPNN